MSATLLDIAAVRARFSALDRRLAFFDGPGGTQCPDEVIDAIARYLREDNANIGAPYETSRRTDAVVDAAHERAAAFLACDPGEVAFGQSMTALNFLLTRALARELEAGDEVLVTRLDHDGNVAPWLALAEDIGIVVRFVDVNDDLSLDLDDLAAKRTPRTKVVAFPAAANSVGTAPDVRRVVELAHEAGALAWVDAVHYGPHGPIDVSGWGCDVLVCSPYKYFGPHMGLAFGREELLRGWRPYKVRPSADEPVGRRFELGTCQHELLAGFVAAVDYVDSLGWEVITAYERSLGQRFLDGLPADIDLHGLPTMEGRVPTFCFSVPGRTAQSVAEHLAERDVAVWWGNYYALETMRLLGLDEVDGAVRAGIVHYNTAEEVDRLLAGVAELAGVRLLLLGGPKFVGRAVIDAAVERGHEVTLFNRGTTGADLYPELERIVGDRDGGIEGLRGREWDAVVDTSGYIPRVVGQSASLLADAVGHYVFVSSISVYASFSDVVNEGSALAELSAPGSEDISADYGALKALCEREVDTAFPGRSATVRAGLIVGPHDPTGRFTYWPHRIARGGDVLVPGPAWRPVQFVDVRDLAAWIVTAAEERLAGPFNATGPATMGAVLDAAKRVAGSSARAAEVDDAFLTGQGVGEWMELPLWIDPTNDDWRHFMEVDTSRATGAGLAFRPLDDTVAATLADAALVEGVGLTPERESELLTAWWSRG